MTLRTRLLLLIVCGLSFTMAFWGWIQMQALEKIVTEQQSKRFEGIADTVRAYYQEFPSGKGLKALNRALHDQIDADARLARIDIFSVTRERADLVAGAGRIAFDWPDDILVSDPLRPLPRYVRVQTDQGLALGVLYPGSEEKGGKRQTLVGVLAFSRITEEILAGARNLLVSSTVVLLVVILLVVMFSYRWLIGRPLRVIVRTMDALQKGQFLQRIPLKRQDEWGRVAAHFNAMAEEIQRIMTLNQELQRRLEDRVREATHRAVQLQRQVNQLQQVSTLGYLTATLAHDLGTPLHSIAGMARLLLERGGWAPDVNRKLALIVQQTDRLNEVIRNIRSATRLPHPCFEAVAAEDILNETRLLVEPLTQRAGIRLSVSVQEPLPLLWIDRHRLQTALLNVIQNALEAMPDGGAIAIDAVPVQEEDRSLVCISIRDTGPGIPSETIDRVLEPFFSTRGEEGLHGLGLAIVGEIVRKVHGGKLRIENHPDGGTRILLYLPCTMEGCSAEGEPPSDPSFRNP